MSNSYEDNYEILDGKQRLTTIINFIDNKFPLDNKYYFKDLSPDDRMTLLGLNVEYESINFYNFERNLTDNEKIELFLIENDKDTKMDEKHLIELRKALK